jgi:2,3-bisphosphoglycerate-independent phosphoglycerate mutase
VKALERIDEHIVAPLLEKLRQFAEWRILVVPDHYTPCTTTAHDATPTPFAMAGHGITPSNAAQFSEAAAAVTGVMVDTGHTLMGQFLSH